MSADQDGGMVLATWVEGPVGAVQDQRQTMLHQLGLGHTPRTYEQLHLDDSGSQSQEEFRQKIQIFGGRLHYDYDRVSGYVSHRKTTVPQPDRHVSGCC
jgi:hypothetical protein